MNLIKEENPVWDINKKLIVGSAEEGTFEIDGIEIGTPLNQEWWKLIDDKQGVLGFAWVSIENEDFEISLAVSDKHQGIGLGSYILNEIEGIAKDRGYSQLIAVVKTTNKNSAKMINWLYKKKYVAYWWGGDGREPKSEEFATNIVKKVDLDLIKNIE